MLRNNFKFSLLALVSIPTLAFSQCTTQEKLQLQQNGYSSSDIAQICAGDRIEKKQTSSKQISIAQTVQTSYSALRVGYLLDGVETGLELSYIYHSPLNSKFGLNTIASLSYTDYENPQGSGSWDDTTKTWVYTSITYARTLYGLKIGVDYNFNKYVTLLSNFNYSMGTETQTGSSDLDVTQMGIALGLKSKLTTSLDFYVSINSFYREHPDITNEKTTLLHSGVFGVEYKF